MSFKLDLGKMKYLKSDGKSTTLQHPLGHTVTLAHSVLSPKNQDALKALATAAQTPLQADEQKHQYGKVIQKAKGGRVACFDEGGRVPAPSQGTGEQDKQARARDIADVSRKGSDKGQMSTATSPSTMFENLKNAWAEGGMLPRYADGTPDRPVEDIGGVQQIIPQQPENSLYSPQTSAKRKEYNDIVASQNQGFPSAEVDPREVAATKHAQFDLDNPSKAPGNFNPDAWNQMENERSKSQQLDANQLANEAMKTAKYNQAAQQAGIPLKPTNDVPSNQDTGNIFGGAQQGQAQIGQPPAQAQPSDMFSTAGYQGATNEMANIGHQQLTQQIAQRQQAMDEYKSHAAKLEEERSNHIQDIKDGYVDPNKYWDSHSKVASGIGMILAGFNPTNRPNAAIEFLHHQLDRSLDAQKANLGAKQSLLQANLHHFQDLHQATLMTQAMLNDTMATQLQSAGLQAKNPLARQAALGASATFAQNAMKFQQELAMRRTMMQLASGAGTAGTQDQAIAMMSAVNPEGAKVYRDAFVPGIGLSKSLTPIPEEVRQQIVSGQKLQNAATDLLNYSKTHTNLNPMSAEYKVGVQKSRILQQMVREGLLGTVFRESEKPLLADFVADNPAGAMKRINSDPKIRTLLESSINQLNTLKQNYNLPTQQQQHQPQESVSKSGRPIISHDGGRTWEYKQ